LNQNFQKWKTCEAITIGLNFESRGYVESICPGGLIRLFTRIQDEVWDF